MHYVVAQLKVFFTLGSVCCLVYLRVLIVPSFYSEEAVKKSVHSSEFVGMNDPSAVESKLYSEAQTMVSVLDIILAGASMSRLCIGQTQIHVAPKD